MFKIFTTISCFFIFSLLLFTPDAVQAYEVSDATSYRVTDTSVLYVLTYSHTIANYESFYPMFPVESQAMVESGKVGMTYQFAGLDSSEYDSVAVVISKASIVDKRYIVPASTKKDFTLAVVLRGDNLPAVTPELRVSDLQVLIQKANETEQGILEPVAHQLDGLRVN